MRRLGSSRVVLKVGRGAEVRGDRDGVVDTGEGLELDELAGGSALGMGPARAVP